MSGRKSLQHQEARVFKSINQRIKLSLSKYQKSNFLLVKKFKRDILTNGILSRLKSLTGQAGQAGHFL